MACSCSRLLLIFHAVTELVEYCSHFTAKYMSLVCFERASVRHKRQFYASWSPSIGATLELSHVWEQVYWWVHAVGRSQNILQEGHGLRVVMVRIINKQIYKGTSTQENPSNVQTKRSLWIHYGIMAYEKAKEIPWSDFNNIKMHVAIWFVRCS